MIKNSLLISLFVTLSTISTEPFSLNRISTASARPDFQVPDYQTPQVVSCSDSFEHPQKEKLKNAKFDYVEFLKAKKLIAQNQFALVQKQSLTTEEFLAWIESAFAGTPHTTLMDFNLEKVRASALLKFSQFYDRKIKNKIISASLAQQLAGQLYKLRLSQITSNKSISEKFLFRIEAIPDEVVIKRIEMAIINARIDEAALAMGMRPVESNAKKWIQRVVGHEGFKSAFFATTVLSSIKTKSLPYFIPEFSVFKVQLDYQEFKKLVAEKGYAEAVSIVQSNMAKRAPLRTKLNLARNGYNALVTTYFFSQALIASVGEIQKIAVELNKPQTAETVVLGDLDSIFDTPSIDQRDAWIEYQVELYSKYLKEKGEIVTPEALQKFREALNSAVPQKK